MNKKIRFLAVALIAVTVFSFGSCDVKTKIEQLRCEHTMDDGEVVKMATCADVGEKVFTCTLCGYTENEDIPAKGHIWQNVEAVSPACTEDGNTSGVNCKVCGEWFIESEKILATGHVVHAIQGYAPTCTETGLTDGSICTVCDEQVIRQEELPANGHNVVTVAGKEPTCCEPGFTNSEACETCGEIFTPQTELLAHGEHVDENNDYLCDIGGGRLTITWNYNEIPFDDVCPNAANKWVRVYKPSAIKGFTGDSVALDLMDLKQFKVYDDCLTLYWGMFHDEGTFHATIEGMTIIETDEYFDFYFAEGSYNCVNLDAGRPVYFLNIDENFQLDLTSSVGFYFLEPPIENE